MPDRALESHRATPHNLEGAGAATILIGKIAFDECCDPYVLGSIFVVGMYVLGSIFVASLVFLIVFDSLWESMLVVCMSVFA